MSLVDLLATRRILLCVGSGGVGKTSISINLGIALAGTTLVGQSIGAGDRAWARRLGNRVIAATQNRTTTTMMARGQRVTLGDEIGQRVAERDREEGSRESQPD